MSVRKVIFWVVLSSLIIFTLAIVKIAWYDRYVWKGTPEHMFNLPAEDRSQWRKNPIQWSTEKQAIEVATPDGLKIKNITFHTNSIGMDFVYIPSGQYRAENGIRETYANNKYYRAKHIKNKPLPALITITKDFYLSAFEVTNKQFELFDPSHQQLRPEYQQGLHGDNHPVEPVTWQQAQRYARWLSQKEGRQYRLPTEAEWEYAARANTKTRLYWGNEFWDRNKANLGGLHSNIETYRLDGYNNSAPVGSFPANPWGLYDMIGNTYEWVNDWWHPNLTEDSTDPRGPDSGKIRMGKGGSWTTRHYAIYAGEDDGNNPADLDDIRGFRLLVEIQ